MKKVTILLGILALALVFGFAGCKSDDNSGPNVTVPVPTPGNLPAIPTGIAAVSSEAEAKTLLAAVRDGVAPYAVDITTAISAAERGAPGYPTGYSATVDTTTSSPTNLKITGTVTGSATSSSMSQSTDITAKVTADAGNGTTTLYKDSTIGVKTSISGSVSGTTVSGSGAQGYGFGLTASSGGRGGKIIISATKSVSGTFTSDPTPDKYTYSGTVTIYGASDAQVYTRKIDSATAWTEVLGSY